MATKICANIVPRWLTLGQGEIYSGLTIRTLQNHIAAGHIRSSNVTAPGNKRGRRLIDRESLDDFIESGVTRPPADIAMNSGRKTKRNLEAVATAGAAR